MMLTLIYTFFYLDREDIYLNNKIISKNTFDKKIYHVIFSTFKKYTSIVYNRDDGKDIEKPLNLSL